MNKKTATIAILICLVIGITAALSFAQRQGQGRQRGGFGGSGMQQGGGAMQRGGMQQGRGAMQQGRMGTRQGAMSMRDPEQMRTMMMERLRTQLRATDQQWTTLRPRLEKVMELTRQTSAGGPGAMFAGRGRGPMGGGFGGPGQMGGGFGGPQGQRGPGGLQAGTPGAPQAAGTAPELTAVEKATQELQTLLNVETPASEQVKTKLAALRQAKVKAKQDLVKAQTELKQGLSINQEATLVLLGYLD